MSRLCRRDFLRFPDRLADTLPRALPPATELDWHDAFAPPERYRYACGKRVCRDLLLRVQDDRMGGATALEARPL